MKEILAKKGALLRKILQGKPAGGWRPEALWDNNLDMHCDAKISRHNINAEIRKMNYSWQGVLLTLRAYDQRNLGLNCQTLFMGPLLLLFWSSSRLAFFWPKRMHLHMRLYVFIFIRNTQKNGPLGIFVWQSSSTGMVDDNWTTYQPGGNPSSSPLLRTEPNTNDALLCQIRHMPWFMWGREYYIMLRRNICLLWLLILHWFCNLKTKYWFLSIKSFHLSYFYKVCLSIII